MNILFLGPVCPIEKIEYIKHISSYFDYPANVLELALIDGFDLYANVTILSSLKMKTRKIFVPQIRFCHNKNKKSNDIILSYIRIPYFEKVFNAGRKYRHFIRSGTRPDVIFVYSTRLDDIRAAYLIKKKYPKTKVISMVTDLPQFMRGDDSSSIYKLLKAFEIKRTHRYMKGCVDGFILLSDYMREHLPIGTTPYLVIEGIFYPEKSVPEIEQEKESKIILYTGNLDARYGIKDLIDAFLLIRNHDYRLYLCGIGDTIEYIKKASDSDTRIKYWGVLSRNEVIKLQKQATLLVNPRHSFEEYTKYSFPSKTMEYMASGTPTLMSPILSLPEDYKKHIYLFDDESIEGMSRTISEICSQNPEELKCFGLSAQNFILNNKVVDIQCKKIIEFIANI